MKHSMTRWFGTTLLALPLLMSMTGTRAAAQVACGDVITGNATMTSDLNCPASNPAVQVNGGNLDMHGHRISGCPGAGIEVIGSGSKVSDGSVNGCLQGVHLNGATGAQLTNIVAISNTDAGFVLSGASGNKLTACTAVGNGTNGGFGASLSDDNSFSRCTASNNAAAGFSVSGTGNMCATVCRSSGGQRGRRLPRRQLDHDAQQLHRQRQRRLRIRGDPGCISHTEP